jgi:hypothetical protein
MTLRFDTKYDDFCLGILKQSQTALPCKNSEPTRLELRKANLDFRLNQPVRPKQRAGICSLL